MNLKDMIYYIDFSEMRYSIINEIVSTLEALEQRILDPDHPEELRDDLIELLGLTDAET